MTALERFRSLVEGAPALGDVLLTGSFLNHRIDVPTLTGAAAELAGRLPSADLVLTAESGGIAPAFAVAAVLGLPMVFARRSSGRVPGEALLQIGVDDHHLFLSREAIPSGSRVLLVDDILGHGRTPLALSGLVSKGGAQTVALAVFIEKTFQGGRNRLETAGVPVFSLIGLAQRGDELILDRRHQG